MNSYIRWFLRHQHRGVESPIPVPPPIHTGRVADLEGLPKDERRAIFLCPECVQVAWYSDKDLRDELESRACPYEQKLLQLVSIEAECAESNCQSPIQILAIWDVARNDLAGNGATSEWKIGDEIRCGKNLHPIRPPSRPIGRGRIYVGHMPF